MYFFGCLTVASNGDFTFTDAPEGVYIQGDGKGNNDAAGDFADWMEKKNRYCPSRKSF